MSVVRRKPVKLLSETTSRIRNSDKNDLGSIYSFCRINRMIILSDIESLSYTLKNTIEVLGDHVFTIMILSFSTDCHCY